MKRQTFALLASLALAAPAFAQPAADVSIGGRGARLELHYSPEENLERIDVALIATARENIDVAAYVLTDVAVIDAFADAAARGVKIRLFVEPNQERDFGGKVGAARERLIGSLNVERRANPRGVWMHLKSYCIDGRLLRMGAANFSASGLKHQDNDLLITDEAGAVKRFQAHFNDMWRQ